MPARSADLPPDRPGETLAHVLLENQLLKEKIAAQTQLMHLLTHQLATPLTALNGSVHLLTEASLKPEQRQEFLAEVQHQVQRLQSLLQDLIALRNAETGALETHPEAFCVQGLVDEVLAGVSHPVTVQVARLAPVWGDRWQISQVLVNLVSNAIKYSPPGRAIEVGAVSSEQGWIEIWVRDRGLGIPTADQPRLFERFFRVRHPDRQHIEGTGLGLSLCKLLVEKQGGQMGFESTHGVGSRFFFTLPTIGGAEAPN